MREQITGVCYSRDKKLKGTFTGASRACGLEGCTGSRLSVKWPDGHHTYPCSKGLAPYKKGWIIL